METPDGDSPREMLRMLYTVHSIFKCMRCIVNGALQKEILQYVPFCTYRRESMRNSSRSHFPATRSRSDNTKKPYPSKIEGNAPAITSARHMFSLGVGVVLRK